MSSKVTPKATTGIKISDSLFEAGLKCLTKCFLLSLGENGSGNAYANWARSHNDAYQAEAIERLTAGTGATECAIRLTDAKDLMGADWLLAVDVIAYGHNLESTIPVVERVSSERGKTAQVVPIRFVYTNKLTRHDKLRVAFDALVASELLNREIDLGKIVHGDDYARVSVKTAPLMGEVRKIVARVAKVLSSHSPPDLVLQRHCGECEFQIRCRREATEKDDLSQLSGMSEKERKKYNSKGIFTVTQLAYPFRPRRRPKRLRDKREKYHHSLKALAIREKKIHIIGNPEVKIEGTPVYLDVEGLPDRDLYYLIGMRIREGDLVVQHSLWADSARDEKIIWSKFLDILSTTETPILIHYGSFEVAFLRRMLERYGDLPNGTISDKAVRESVNLLSVIYGQVYFPGFSNGLKDAAGSLGFNWTDTDCSGLLSIAWRYRWEDSSDGSAKEKLLRYNAQDCEALELLTGTIRQIRDPTKTEPIAQAGEVSIVRADSDGFLQKSRWKRFASPVSSLEYINAAAHWDYQRNRVYARSGKVKQKAEKRVMQRRPFSCVEKVHIWERSRTCPRCNRSYYIKGPERTRTVHDILYGRRSLKLRLVKYIFQTYLCRKCGTTFGMPDRFQISYKYGWNLFSYLSYQVIDLCIPQRTVMQSFNRLFGYDLSRSTLSNLKSRAAEYYAATKQQILERILRGSLIHVDETRANIKGKSAFVWVLASFHEVA